MKQTNSYFQDDFIQKQFLLTWIWHTKDKKYKMKKIPHSYKG